MDAAQSPVRAELDRVGASFRRAGAAGYITVTDMEDGVRLVGPPRDHPRRDDAGTDAVWRALSG
jgi:hypothetical protein